MTPPDPLRAALEQWQREAEACRRLQADDGDTSEWRYRADAIETMVRDLRALLDGQPRAALATDPAPLTTPDPLRSALDAIKAEHDRDGHREPCDLCVALAADTAPLEHCPSCDVEHDWDWRLAKEPRP